MRIIFDGSMIFVVALLTTQIVAASEYIIKDVGLAGRTTYPGSVNDLGVAVFTAFPEGSSENITSKGEGYKYEKNVLSLLTGLGGAYDAVFDINNFGSAVGHSNSGDIHSTPTRAVIYKNGQSFDLGVNPGIGSYAAALNDSEQVVGYTTFNGEQHAFLYAGPGNVLDLGTPGVSSAAYDINAAGQVVGSFWGFNAQDNFSEKAFLYTNGQMVSLGTLGGSSSFAGAINNLEQVVGSSLTTNGEYHAFIYDSIHGMRDIGPPGRSSDATDINDHGIVIGTIYLPVTGRQAVLFNKN